MSRSISLLKEICASHERLALIAEKLEWDKVSAEWSVSEKNLIDLTKVGLGSLKEKERKEAIDLIEKILVLQSKITARVKPWQEQVRPLLDSFDRYPLKLESENEAVE